MTYFDTAPIEEADSFERTDLTQHRAYVSDLVAAWRKADDGKVAVGQVTVLTGDMIEKGVNKGRGKEEAADERGFRKIAKELNVGLRVTHRHLPDGRTVLRISPQNKKEFSDDAIAKRTAALEKRRERLAVEKYAKDQGKQVQHLSREEAQKAVTAYRAAKKAAAQKKAAASTDAS